MTAALVGLKAFLRRHTLWAGFVAALLPLLVLLGVQSVWLARLARASATVHRAALGNCLEAISTDVQNYYRSAAESSLDLPPSIFTEGRFDAAAIQWNRKPIRGVRRYFLVDFTREPFGHFLVYDPVRETLESPPASDESLAIVVACLPWSYGGGGADSLSPSADERDPDHRIILNPIADGTRLVGVAGMILDEEFFRSDLLPAAIQSALRDFFPEAAREDLAVTVRDARGELVLGAVGGQDSGDAATARFPFVFTDWTLGLRSRDFTPERWASANFRFNMMLSAVLAIALLGGIVLALRAANRAVRLSEMKSEFVSNISHELRTPLASIRVFAELLRLGKVPSPEKVQEYGEYIEAESRRLSRLINNILDFSRIDSGRKTYRFIRADVAEVVATTLRSFEVRLKHSGFELAFEGPVGPLPRVEMDPDAIGQALHNLLDNAVKYSAESTAIDVRLAREGAWVVISVRDRGIGIARDEQERIFERFHRIGTGLVHDVRGSGLGLSIVHHIVQAHRGRVRVQSEPGKGSTFSVYLPVGRPAPGPKIHEAVASESSPLGVRPDA